MQIIHNNAMTDIHALRTCRGIQVQAPCKSGWTLLLPGVGGAELIHSLWELRPCLSVCLSVA